MVPITSTFAGTPKRSPELGSVTSRPLQLAKRFPKASDADADADADALINFDQRDPLAENLGDVSAIDLRR